MTIATPPYAANADADHGAAGRKLLDKLNTKQAEAVCSPAESALVLAGAGSGKTTVLTRRTAWLVNEGYAPRALMTVTFTNKSAEEMKKRLRSIMTRDQVNEIWVGTFHSICNRMLRENCDAAGLPKNFGILDVDGQETLIRGLLKDAKAAGTVASKPRGKAAEAAAAVDGEANDDPEEEKITPKLIADYINKKKEFGIRPAEITPANATEETMLEFFRLYQKACTDQGVVDFNDLLSLTVKMLKSDVKVLAKYRAKFQGILVDEFQDTNDVQYEWLTLLANPGGEPKDSSFVMAVGDDDQSIYSFRNANPVYMQKFLKDFASDRCIKLEQNYRSLPYILETANALIGVNQDRLGKRLWSDKADKSERILATEYGNGYHEATATARKIKELITRKVPGSEIAVLYRTNMQSRMIEGELNKLGVPVTVYGGFRFYERQEVKNVMAYLDLACSFDRDLSFARVVNFPPRGLGERTVEDVRQQSKEHDVSMMEMIGLRSEMGVTSAAAQKKQAMLEQFASAVMDIAERAQLTTLPELVEHLVVATGIMAHYESLGEEDAEERISNVNELVAATQQFAMEHPQYKTAAEALPEYLSFVALMSSTSEADMDKKNTVSLMTVHAAKGLEFDHVYVIGLEDGVFPHSRALKDAELQGNGKSMKDAWAGQVVDAFDEFAAEEAVAKDAKIVEPVMAALEEERRLLYVALTRARKELEVSHVQRRMINGEEQMMDPSRFLKELPSRRVLKVRDSSASASNKTGFNAADEDQSQGAWDDAPKAKGAPAYSMAPMQGRSAAGHRSGFPKPRPR